MRQTPAREFVVTPTAERTFEKIRLARDTGSVALFTGPAGVGKTTIIQNFLREDRDARHLTFSSASRNLSSVLKNIADTLNIQLGGRSTYEINREVESWLSWKNDGRRYQQVFANSATHRGPYILFDEIQNIDLGAIRQVLHFNDIYGLPVIMFGNEHTMKRTRANEAAFDQVDDRIRFRDRIDRTREDVAAICDTWMIHDADARAWVQAYAFFTTTTERTTYRDLFSVLRAALNLAGEDVIKILQLQDALGFQNGQAAARTFLLKFSTLKQIG